MTTRSQHDKLVLKNEKRTDTIHVVIPDTQAKYGVPTAHLRWAGRYIAEKYAGHPKLRLIHIGDHSDMESLSSYDRKGGSLMEGRRYKTDVKYANDSWDILNEPIEADKERYDWDPDEDFFMGNHENRIVRAIEQDAQMEGLISLDDLAVVNQGIWRVHEFLKPKTFDGVTYAHYFTARGTGKPLGGQSIDARIKTVGHSFTQGHTQGLWFGRREIIGGAHLGLVAGSFYLHDEHYLGPQGNTHWRGIVICHDVRRGDYDPKFVSIRSLCERYEGKSLGVYLGRH